MRRLAEDTTQSLSEFALEIKIVVGVLFAFSRVEGPCHSPRPQPIHG